MKIRDLNEIVKEYNQDQIESIRRDREKLIIDLPYSVVVTADYEEINTAKNWCLQNFGETDIVWSALWYGKIDYDYGYIEFFFKNKENRDKFERVVASLITQYPSGVKGKTVDGPDIVGSE